LLGRSTVPAALAVALCVAGCGPPRAAKPGFFDLGSTARCLDDAGLTVRKNPDDLDFVSRTAPDGALISEQSGTVFTIAFGESQEDALLLVNGYKRSARSAHERKRLDSLLDREGNAVVYWHKEPTPAQASSVRSCLK
jgi:hypothetical protein